MPWMHGVITIIGMVVGMAFQRICYPSAHLRSMFRDNQEVEKMALWKKHALTVPWLDPSCWVDKIIGPSYCNSYARFSSNMWWPPVTARYISWRRICAKTWSPTERPWDTHVSRKWFLFLHASLEWRGSKALWVAWPTETTITSEQQHFLLKPIIISDTSKSWWPYRHWSFREGVHPAVQRQQWEWEGYYLSI